MSSLAEVRVHFAALVVAVVKARMDAAALDELWEWGEEYLELDRDEFDELITQEDPDGVD